MKKEREMGNKRWFYEVMCYECMILHVNRIEVDYPIGHDNA